MVEIETARSLEAHILGCPSYKKTNETIVVLSKKVLSKACFLHDCKGGHCKIVEKSCTEKVEQEKVTRRKNT